MQTIQKIQEQAISLFFSEKTYACLQKNTICKRLNISIYELDRILDNYYAEMDNVNVFRLAWPQTHPSSYILPKKQSFIDFIVKKEHGKYVRQQLKENNGLERGVAI